MSSALRFRTALQRKDPRLPVFIRIPGAVLAPWQLNEWITVEGTLNGQEFGRRTIKDWGKGSPDWFVEFTRPFLGKAGLAPGDKVEVELRRADTTIPDEMAMRMKSDAAFRRVWEGLKSHHKRAALEYYLDAKTPAGRTKRLDKIAQSVGA